MKHFNYSFTNNDIETLLITLSVLPNIEIDDVSEVQQNINDRCCFSAIDKLSAHDANFHPNEIRVMAVSLMISDQILRNEFVTSQEIKSELSKYMFTINKLLPIFSAAFD